MLRIEPVAWTLTTTLTALLLGGSVTYFILTLSGKVEEPQAGHFEAVGVWAIGVLIPLSGGVFAWKKLQWERNARILARTKDARRVKARFHNPLDGHPLPEYWVVKVRPPAHIDLTDLAIGVIPGEDLHSPPSSFNFTSLQVGGREFEHQHISSAAAALVNKEEFKSFTSSNSENVWLVFTVEATRFVADKKHLWVLERAPWSVLLRALRVTSVGKKAREALPTKPKVASHAAKQ